jgi:hypothetical protein
MNRKPRRRIALALLTVASVMASSCRDSRRARPAPQTLAGAVAALLTASDLERAIADLHLDREAFARVLVAPYHRLYAEYSARFATEAPQWLNALRRHSREPVIAVRRHYGGDVTLSPAQARLRWALPVQAESWLVELDGALLDTVWVADRGRWYPLLGLDTATLELLNAAAPGCSTAARLAGQPGVCSDAVWMATDAALRRHGERTQRACARAVQFCR